MTPKQRFDQLFEGREQDGPPLFRPILMHFAARYSSRTYGELASDYRVLVDCNMKAMEDFNMDMVGLISDPYRETSAFGAKISFPAEAVPVCEEIIIKSMHDVRQLKQPDVYKNERTLDRIKGAELYQEKLKGQVPVIGWIEGPLAEACDLAGVSEMMMKLMMEPDFCNILMDKCVQTAKDFAKAQVGAGCDIIGMGDAICSQLDPGLYRSFVLERHKEIVEYIQSMGAKIKLHICGNITHLLPSIKELNVDILDLDWQVNPQEAFQVIGPEVIRCGNINPVNIQDFPEQRVYETAKKLLEKEKGRKFILSGGCEITVNTPPENLKAMDKARINV